MQLSAATMKLVLGVLMVVGVASLPKLTFRRTPNAPAPCALESDGQSVDSTGGLGPRGGRE